MPKVKLTHQFILGLDPKDYGLGKEKGERREKTFYDKKKSGLILRLAYSGSKTFSYRYDKHGKKRQYKIGRFPETSLAAARKKIDKLKAQINDGEDPQQVRNLKKKQEAPATIKDLAEEYKKRHFPKLKESTVSSYRARIDAEILPAFGSMPIEQLTRGDIIAFLEEIAFEDEKPVHANRVRNVFSSMFSFGVQKGIAEYNPVSTVKPVAEETSRKRVYNDEEIKALWKAFEQQEEPLQSVLKMLLICGQRKGETCNMEWDYIEKGVWTIPDHLTKNGRTHYVPLSGMAIQVLDNLPQKGEYVFPSRLDKEQPIRWISSSAKRIRKLSKVNDFRLHDLRRTCASGIAALGIDRTVLGKVLNHKGLAGDSQVTAIYDRYEYMDEKEQALNRWSHKLQQILEGKEANINQIA